MYLQPAGKAYCECSREIKHNMYGNSGGDRLQEDNTTQVTNGVFIMITHAATLAEE